MSKQGYTPTEAEICEDYVGENTRNFDSYLVGHSVGEERMRHREAFYRAVAKIKADAARKALLDAAKEIREALDPNEVSKAQQGRMRYAIGFLEASADEYKEIS